MPITGNQQVTAIILDAGEKSAAIDISGAKSVGLQFPVGMEAVAVTFEVSQDGATYFPLYVQATPTTQALLTLASPTASKCFTLANELAPWNYMKIAAVVAADRTVLLTLGD